MGSHSTVASHPPGHKFHHECIPPGISLDIPWIQSDVQRKDETIHPYTAYSIVAYVTAPRQLDDQTERRLKSNGYADRRTPSRDVMRLSCSAVRPGWTITYHTHHSARMYHCVTSPQRSLALDRQFLNNWSDYLSSPLLHAILYHKSLGLSDLCGGRIGIWLFDIGCQAFQIASQGQTS